MESINGHQLLIFYLFFYSSLKITFKRNAKEAVLSSLERWEMEAKSRNIVLAMKSRWSMSFLFRTRLQWCYFLSERWKKIRCTGLRRGKRMTKSRWIYRRKSEFVKYKAILLPIYKCILHEYRECINLSFQ